MTKKKKRRKDTPGARTFRIETTVSFGEEGIPLEQFGEVRKMLQERHQDLVSRPTRDSPLSRSTATWISTCRAIPPWTGRHSPAG